MALVAGIMMASFLIFFGIFLLIAILYLLNLQKTLKAAAPENRKLPPANVWLLLIPIFNIFYMFIVAKRMTETIVAEYASKGQALENPKPTYSVGMGMAILGVVSMIFSFIQLPSTIASYSNMSTGNLEELTMQAEASSGPLSNLSSLISLVAFVLWIVYWVQTAGYKNKMRNLPNNKVESDIFGGI
ncbi:MAG TPA: hypothetical protein VLZ83_04990 [Edaphocola sp.]|nr:hypothetical protein [Edaphocola sp.]